ncbi:MAG: hypothetical protein IKM54_06340 [Butyricicoccus sp.]|nr:hypothetical protein [Butyricicoccus sp.]
MNFLRVLPAAAILFFIILYLVYRKAFYSPDKTQENIYNIPGNDQYAPYRAEMTALIDDLAARPFEAVSITSHDGLTLCGRYYHYQNGAPLDLCFHGYRGTAVRDMCGGIRISYALGHNVLLVDQRAHGKSAGHTISFGIHERLDCRDWVRWAVNRFGSDVRILLYGVSMGAATVLMASALDLGPQICGIVADSPYDAPANIIRKVCRDMKLPPSLAMPLVKWSARLFGGFDLYETDAVRAVRRTNYQIILLHGEEDRFVPCDMSRAIADANPSIERHTFPEAGHGISDIVHTDRYTEVVSRFIQTHCPFDIQK